MDNAGDWLYLVFLVIAGISSLLGSKNKKKRPKQILGQPDREIVTGEDPVPGKSLVEIPEEMQNPKPAKRPVATSKSKPAKPPVAEPAPFLTAEKTVGRHSRIGNRSDVSPAEKESLLADIAFDNAAELRKAVIYAEILNRKY